MSTSPTGRILVVGATSGIGRAVCCRFAEEGERLVLAGRNKASLSALATDLRERFDAEVTVEPYDALQVTNPEAFLDRCASSAGGPIDGLLVCHGYLPTSEATSTDPAVVRRAIEVNFVSVAVLLTVAAQRMEGSPGSWIAAISSVAGDRGRRDNYAYGSAKGGLSLFLQGLRSRLHPHGVHVLTVKPGFVDTAMLRESPAAGSRLAASPDRVARDICAAVRRRRDVVYSPWYWRFVLAVLRAIPERLFKRLPI